MHVPAGRGGAHRPLCSAVPWRAIDGVRVPLAITSVVLVCLSVGLLASQFAMNRTMGAVVAPIIALAWIADVVLLPALLDLLSKRNWSMSSC